MSLDVRDRAQSLRAVRQYQSEVEAIREAEAPRGARLTIHALSLLVALILLVLFVARTDRIVSSQTGKMTSLEPETLIQALDSSIIKSLDVREGERVEKGQVLATLDPTFAAATVNQLRAQSAALRAQIARDRAELNGQPLRFDPPVEPGDDAYEGVQRGLYEQQLAQYAAQLKSFDQKIALAKATIAKYESDASRYREREAIAQQIEGMRSTLEKHGTGSLLNRLESTDTRVEAARTMEMDENSIREGEHSLASLQADREAFTQQFRSTASQELATAEASLGAAQAQLEAATRHKDLVKLTASEDSIVLAVAKSSVGAVLREGDTLMTLIPIRVPVEAEVRLSPRDVGFVRAGDPVTIKVEAFNFAEHGTVAGHVRWISEDAFNEEATGPGQGDPYYKARIAIDEIKLINVPATFRLMPGMTLTADIRVGSRSLGAYLFGSLVRGAGDSMREP